MPLKFFSLLEAMSLTTYVLDQGEYSKVVDQKWIDLLLPDQSQLQQTTFTQIEPSPPTIPTLSTGIGGVSAGALEQPTLNPGSRVTNGTAGPSLVPGSSIAQIISGTEMLFMPTAPPSGPLPRESPVVSLLIDTNFTPTPSLDLEIVQVESSYRSSGTGYNVDAPGFPTLEPQVNSHNLETTHVIVIVVAIVGIITLLVSITMTIMYFIRSRSTPGIVFLGRAKPTSNIFRRMVTKIQATAFASTAPIGNFVSSIFKPARIVQSVEPGRTIPSSSVPSNTHPSPTTPLIPIPETQITSVRPDRTPLGFLYTRSPSVQWEAKPKEDSLPVPGDFALTRPPSVNTSASKSDPENSLVIVDDGEPLPEPPARLRRTPAMPTTHSVYPITNRHSVPTSLNFHTMSAFYGLPGGDSSDIMYNTAPESPVSHIPSALSPPPPAQAFNPSQRQTREAKGKTPTRYERGMSVGCLGGSQAASSHQNSVLLGPPCMYDPLACNYVRHSQGSEIEYPPFANPFSYGADRFIGKPSHHRLGCTDFTQNTHRRHSASMTDFRGLGTEEPLNTYPELPERRQVANVGLLVDRSSFTRQSSIRGSGSVNCSKPSLVSLHASRHGSEENAEIASGESTEEEGDEWPSTTLSRAGSHRCGGPLSKRNSKAGLVQDAFGQQRSSGTDTLSSCDTTGSSILYHVADSEPASGGEHSLPQPEGFCLSPPRPLATLLENTSSDTFGKSTAFTKPCPRLIPGEINFPLPWTHDLCIPPKLPLGHSYPLPTTAGACKSNRVSMSSMFETTTFSPSRMIRLPMTTPGPSTRPDLDAPPSGISDYIHTPSIDVLIHQLKQPNKICSCNCSSSSSVYSTNSHIEPNLGHSTNSSGSSDYLPPPSARDSVAQYLISSDISSPPLAPSVPETAATNSPLFSYLSNSKPCNTFPQTDHHTFPRPFIFPLQTPTSSSGTRHSLPLPLTEISTLTSSPYLPPKVIHKPPPFSSLRNAEIPSPRPVTRGKYHHYRRSSFNGSLNTILTNARTPSPTTSLTREKN